MEQHHHTHYLNVNPTDVGDRDRFPQWTTAETKEFLAIRSELDPSFMETKRNKLLWESISSKMYEKGFARTPDQCKSKWKNLVTRYKGSEGMEAEASRQFPFHDEMRKIFSERMERLLSFGEGRRKGVQVQVKEWSDEEEEESKKKRKVERKHGGLEDELKEFARRQMEMELRWVEAVEAVEAREAERREKEVEWRRAMAALQEERVVMERRWREREEERRVREEARAERRHALLTALFTKLAQKGESSWGV